jgi:hypothetical protein
MAYTINPAGVYAPDSALYEPEHRYQFTAENPAGPHVVIQGTAGAAEGALLGNEDEEIANEYEMHLVVGPYWKYVDSAVPSVTINGFWNSNADEDDQQIWIQRIGYYVFARGRELGNGGLNNPGPVNN